MSRELAFDSRARDRSRALLILSSLFFSLSLSLLRSPAKLDPSAARKWIVCYDAFSFPRKRVSPGIVGSVAHEWSDWNMYTTCHGYIVRLEKQNRRPNMPGTFLAPNTSSAPRFIVFLLAMELGQEKQRGRTLDVSRSWFLRGWWRLLRNSPL